MRALALALLMTSVSTAALAQAEPATTPEQIAETMERHVGHGTPSATGMDAQPVQVPSPAMPTALDPVKVNLSSAGSTSLKWSVHFCSRPSVWKCACQYSAGHGLRR